MTTCKYCPKRIVWGIDEKGTRVPLDPVAPVYHVLQFDAASGSYAVERDGGIAPDGTQKPVHYVSHFATCAGASKASKKNHAQRPDHRALAAGE